MNRVPILAGFDPGLVRGGTLRGLGITRIRDGLPAGHPVRNRIGTAVSADMEVIWDLFHFDLIADAESERHARNVGAVARQFGGSLWVCPMNEPGIVRRFQGEDWPAERCVETGLRALSILRAEHPDVRVVTADVINGGGEWQYGSTDPFVAAGAAVIGINYYPQWASAPLSEVILATWRRYGLPVMVSETSWHVGHPEQSERHPWCRSKGQWLLHVLGEAERAACAGAVVDGVCWYPATCMPSWDVDGEVWDNGLIRSDLSLDRSLVDVIAEHLEWRAAA